MKCHLNPGILNNCSEEEKQKYETLYKDFHKKVEELNMQTLNLNDFEEEAPVLPQEPEEDEAYDLQKELEAKFDELFGPIEEDS